MGKVLDWVRGHAIASVVIAFVLGVGAGGAGTTSTDESDPTAATAAEDEPEETTEEVVEEEEEQPVEEPVFDRPTKDDFKLKIKTLSNTCFGSAGCNTEIRVGLVYLGPGKLDPTRTYELTYKIVGADDQLTSTIEVTGKSYTVDEHLLSTGTNAHLEAIVTRVEAF